MSVSITLGFNVSMDRPDRMVGYGFFRPFQHFLCPARVVRGYIGPVISNVVILD